ncbi:aminoalcoholphosphotransferase 1 [Perilla frutescens var. hirtella]|uniref:Aminoalcoholphosphotransferase 1 n=1 Tax=Perilla frutescens var. hirtella TaxID=608512 RepID=A0AAD4NW44_PERFH|nr:aminoalcoholphosphotransferase 1 [Perilla frutescens var. hirtella]
MQIYSPKLDSPPPRWVNFAHGLLLFNSLSIADCNLNLFLPQQISGCDALGCAFEALAFGSTAMCGGTTFWFWVISGVLFYYTTWEKCYLNEIEDESVLNDDVGKRLNQMVPNPIS